METIINPITRRIIKSLIGQIFGRLKVIAFDESLYNKKDMRIYWKCQCDCGNLVSVRDYQLKSGNTISCGCYSKEKTKERTSVDYTGMKIGMLTVLEKTNKKDGRANVWKCQCDCGNIVYVRSTHLGSNETTSCGCSKKSKAIKTIENMLQLNNINYIEEKRIYVNATQYVKFDFLVENSYVIEYDGEQHFKLAWGGEERLKHQMELDNIKNEYCKSHNIQIIRIPYTHQDDIRLSDLIPNTSRFLI